MPREPTSFASLPSSFGGHFDQLVLRATTGMLYDFFESPQTLITRRQRRRSISGTVTHRIYSTASGLPAGLVTSPPLLGTAHRCLLILKSAPLAQCKMRPDRTKSCPWSTRSLSMRRPRGCSLRGRTSGSYACGPSPPMATRPLNSETKSTPRRLIQAPLPPALQR